MTQLLLVKHAAPAITEGLPSSAWPLSAKGQQQCEDLHARLVRYRPGVIFTSREPKAAETAAILGSRFGLPAAPWPGLHETDRTGLPFFRDVGDLELRMQDFFDRSSERVIGNESADEAHARFGHAVRTALASTAERVSVVVAHGTVISLLAGRANHLDPHALWRELDFTTFVVLSAASFHLEAIVHSRTR
jgi:broad specificity phosphatase PhoE